MINQEILYLCNQKLCGENGNGVCSYPVCKHTHNPEYAVNFEKEGDYYVEKETK